MTTGHNVRTVVDLNRERDVVMSDKQLIAYVTWLCIWGFIGIVWAIHAGCNRIAKAIRETKHGG